MPVEVEYKRLLGMLALLLLPLLQMYVMEKRETREKRLTKSCLEGRQLYLPKRVVFF